MYDWANSAFAVIILTAVFPVYYRALVTNAGHSPEDATAYWAYTTSASMLIVALVGPVLGAMADIVGGTKRFLGVALVLGVLGSAGLAFLGKDTFLLGALIFAIGNLGFAGGSIFYEALLPHVARPDDIDRVSARGYALGYLGGGLLLIINALWLLRPDWFWMPDREFALGASFVSVAVWWLVFALPLLRTVPEPRQARRSGRFDAPSVEWVPAAGAHPTPDSPLPAVGPFSRWHFGSTTMASTPSSKSPQHTVMKSASVSITTCWSPLS